MDISQAFTASIEAALNRYLALDPEALARFSSLEGKIISIEIKGLDQSFCLFPSADGFMLLKEFDGEADATISGTLMALTKLAMAEDPRDYLFNGDINISGDTQLANQFSLLLSGLDIDWEEILAQNIGDITAHKVGNGVRSINQWVKRSTRSVCLDAGEYLQEESRLSPSNSELKLFVNKVDAAREGVDRLAARIQNLKKNK